MTITKIPPCPLPCPLPECGAPAKNNLTNVWCSNPDCPLSLVMIPHIAWGRLPRVSPGVLTMADQVRRLASAAESPEDVTLLREFADELVAVGEVPRSGCGGNCACHSTKKPTEDPMERITRALVAMENSDILNNFEAEAASYFVNLEELLADVVLLLKTRLR